MEVLPVFLKFVHVGLHADNNIFQRKEGQIARGKLCYTCHVRGKYKHGKSSAVKSLLMC